MRFYSLSNLPAFLLVLLGLPSASFAATTLSLSGIAVQNPYIAGANTNVAAGSLFALVAAPSGSSTFAIAANNAIAANSSLAVGSSLDGDTIFYVGTTTNALGNINGLVTMNNFDISGTGSAGNIAGDSFALVWFPSLTGSNTTVPAGTSYGVTTDQVSSEKWVLPTTSQGYSFGSGQNYTSIITPGQANFTASAVPEPSKSFLLLFGLFGAVLRRRRA